MEKNQFSSSHAKNNANIGNNIHNTTSTTFTANSVPNPLNVSSLTRKLYCPEHNEKLSFKCQYSQCSHPYTCHLYECFEQHFHPENNSQLVLRKIQNPQENFAKLRQLEAVLSKDDFTTEAKKLKTFIDGLKTSMVLIYKDYKDLHLKKANLEQFQKIGTQSENMSARKIQNLEKDVMEKVDGILQVRSRLKQSIEALKKKIPQALGSGQNTGVDQLEKVSGQKSKLMQIQQEQDSQQKSSQSKNSSQQQKSVVIEIEESSQNQKPLIHLQQQLDDINQCRIFQANQLLQQQQQQKQLGKNKTVEEQGTYEDLDKDEVGKGERDAKGDGNGIKQIRLNEVMKTKQGNDCINGQKALNVQATQIDKRTSSLAQNIAEKKKKSTEEYISIYDKFQGLFNNNSSAQVQRKSNYRQSDFLNNFPGRVLTYPNIQSTPPPPVITSQPYPTRQPNLTPLQRDFPLKKQLTKFLEQNISPKFTWDSVCCQQIYSSWKGLKSVERFHQLLEGKKNLLFFFIGEEQGDGPDPKISAGFRSGLEPIYKSSGKIIGSYYPSRYPRLTERIRYDKNSFLFISDVNTKSHPTSHKFVKYIANQKQFQLSVNDKLHICHGNTPSYADGIRTFQKNFNSINYCLPTFSYKLEEDLRKQGSKDIKNVDKTDEDRIEESQECIQVVSSNNKQSGKKLVKLQHQTYSGVMMVKEFYVVQINQDIFQEEEQVIVSGANERNQGNSSKDKKDKSDDNDYEGKSYEKKQEKGNANGKGDATSSNNDIACNLATSSDVLLTSQQEMQIKRRIYIGNGNRNGNRNENGNSNSQAHQTQFQNQQPQSNKFNAYNILFNQYHRQNPYGKQQSSSVVHQIVEE